MDIIPAIMPDSFEDLIEKVNLVTSSVSLVQIDVMDGVYVPSRSWPYPVEGDFDQDVARLLIESEEISEIDFEVDLMVSDPAIQAPNWIRAGARRVIIHFSSVDNVVSVIELVRASSVPIDSPLAVECGLAIGVDVDLDQIKDIVPLVDFVQCMGIYRIGYQGQSFAEEVVHKVSGLRRLDSDLIISVDGGVNLDTAPSLIEAGVDRLVAGSAIFNHPNTAEAIAELQRLG